MMMGGFGPNECNFDVEHRPGLLRWDGKSGTARDDVGSVFANPVSRY